MRQAWLWNAAKIHQIVVSQSFSPPGDEANDAVGEGGELKPLRLRDDYVGGAGGQDCGNMVAELGGADKHDAAVGLEQVAPSFMESMVPFGIDGGPHIGVPTRVHPAA